MKLVFRASALTDISAIHNYIAERDPQAARRVIARIRAATKRLILFPRSGRKGAVGGTYELIVSGLPFIVVYQITAEAVEVIAVFHAARDHARGPAIEFE